MTTGCLCGGVIRARPYVHVGLGPSGRRARILSLESSSETFTQRLYFPPPFAEDDGTHRTTRRRVVMIYACRDSGGWNPVGGIPVSAGARRRLARWHRRGDGRMTADEQGYNGWTNYPTWNVALWLDNDEFLYHEVRILRGVDRSDLADQLKVLVEGLVEDIAPAVFEASFVADLFGYSMDQVDWHELAEHYADEDEDAEVDA